MSITKNQATNPSTHIFHIGTCTRIVGPRGGIKVTIAECRRNGRTQTWKTRPEDFMVPVKRGLYEYGYIDHSNSQDFHIASECPITGEEE